jgi:SAM-dependent methyltransferase
LGAAKLDRQTIEYYDRNAESVVRRYEGVPGGISDFFRFVFLPGDSVLEIGSGSGRDAARLMGLGVHVHAVEPSAELRHRAAVLHPELSGRVFAGELPSNLPLQVAGPYDGVVLSAVIMHIPDSELFDAALAIRERLRDGGKLLLSTTLERGDTPPDSDRDKSGRLMILRSPSQVRLLFERLGFILKSEWTSADAAGRSDVLWVTMHFQYSHCTARPIDRIESILNADKKVATYKLALIRALCDMALTAHARARWEPDGRVSISITDLAERWILYYWPLVDSREFIPQINGESTGGKPIAFRSALSELTEHFSRQGRLNGFAKVKADQLLSMEEQRLYGQVLRIVSNTIVKGPVKYAGGARGVQEFEFDAAGRRVLVDGAVWEELTLMGHWIRDAVILRWADMTWRLSAGVLPRGKILDRLVLTSDPARFDESVRQFYAGLQPMLECVWSGRKLVGDFDVDHAIPFALWQDSSLWNLFPAAKIVNNQKRDGLPSREIVRRRSESIIENWRSLSRAFPSRFVHAAAALSGSAVTVRNKEGYGHAVDMTGDATAGTMELAPGWEIPLLSSFVEAIEYTAAMRGAARWEP